MLAVKECILGANLPWTVLVTRDNLMEGVDSKDCPGNVQRPAVVGVECLGSPEQAVEGLRQLSVLLTQACKLLSCQPSGLVLCSSFSFHYARLLMLGS